MNLPTEPFRFCNATTILHAVSSCRPAASDEYFATTSTVPSLISTLKTQRAEDSTVTPGHPPTHRGATARQCRAAEGRC